MISQLSFNVNRLLYSSVIFKQWVLSIHYIRVRMKHGHVIIHLLFRVVFNDGFLWYERRVANYKSQVVSYKSRIASYKNRIASYESQFGSYGCQVEFSVKKGEFTHVSYKSRYTSYKAELRVTSVELRVKKSNEQLISGMLKIEC